LKAPFTENSFVASYSDTVFRREIIEKILAVDGDVVFCIDILWKERYELRSEEDIRSAETLEITGQQVDFTGLIAFKSATVKRITTLSESEVGTSMLDLIDYLGKTELSVNPFDVAGNWAEFNSTIDIARFILGTKAETLARLEP